MELEDDDDLLRRCQHGDDSAMDDLVGRFQDRIFRLSFRVLGDVAPAEDATADALAKVWMRCRSWRGDSSAGTWIYRIAWRVILDQQRSSSRWRKFWEAREQLVARSTADTTPGIESQEERSKQVRDLQGALAELVESDRALVHMFYYEQKPISEISIILGVSREAIKMRLTRVRKRLRERLEKNNDE